MDHRRYPHSLSGGEQQRIALARALAPRPRIMLMDEPFSGLDNRLRDGIRDETLAILKDEDTAVLLVTHEPEEALRMADEIALMRDGKIVQQGAPYNIYNAPVDKAAVAFFSDINVIRGTSNGALTDTPFGQFLTPGFEDGEEVEIVIRPQHLKLDFDRHGKGPLPTPGRWGRGTGRGRAGAVYGHGEPCGISHGSRRIDVEGDGAECVPAQTRHAALAHAAAGPLFRIPRRALRRVQPRPVVFEPLARFIDEKAGKDADLGDLIGAQGGEIAATVAPDEAGPDTPPVIKLERPDVAHCAILHDKAEFLAASDRGAQCAQVAEALGGVGKGVDGKAKGFRRAVVVFGKHGVDLGREALCGVAQVAINPIADGGKPKMQRLQFGFGQVQGGRVMAARAE